MKLRRSTAMLFAFWIGLQCPVYAATLTPSDVRSRLAPEANTKKTLQTKPRSARTTIDQKNSLLDLVRDQNSSYLSVNANQAPTKQNGRKS